MAVNSIMRGVECDYIKPNVSFLIIVNHFMIGFQIW